MYFLQSNPGKRPTIITTSSIAMLTDTQNENKPVGVGAASLQSAKGNFTHSCRPLRFRGPSAASRRPKLPAVASAAPTFPTDLVVTCTQAPGACRHPIANIFRSSSRPLLRKCRTGCLDRIHLYSDISRWNEFDSDFEPFCQPIIGIVTAGYNIPEFLKQFSL